LLEKSPACLGSEWKEMSSFNTKKSKNNRFHLKNVLKNKKHYVQEVSNNLLTYEFQLALFTEKSR